MDILLIKSHRYVSGHVPGSNLGLNILTQLLRQKNYRVEMLQGYAKASLIQIRELMKTQQPRIVGFYCDFNNIHWVKMLAREIKDSYPEVILLAGGPQTVGLDKAFFSQTGIQAACIGEGEETILELMDYFLNNKGRLSEIQGILYPDENKVLIETPSRKPPQDLDQTPWPDITLTDDYQYYGLLPILTGRGCPFGCTFCYEGANSRTVRRHSVDALMTEIKKNFRRDPDIKYINFLDDTFTLDHNRVNSICREISELRQDYDFVWFASAHISTIDKHREMAKNLSEAGLKKIFFGLESGCDTVLKEYNKKISKKMVLDVVDHCIDSGIHSISGNIILGGPHETKKTIQESEELITELLYRAPGQFETAYFSFLPYPRTPITMNPEKFGMSIYTDLIDCCNEDIPLSRTEELDFMDLLNTRLQANKRLQQLMMSIYLEGKIPEEIILESYRLIRHYGIFTRWNDYVYKNLPIDNAYWTMRASGDYFTGSQVGTNDEDAIILRTFEYWLYTELTAEGPRIFGKSLSPLDETLLKLCGGRLSKKEVIRRAKKFYGAKNPDFYQDAEKALNQMEKSKWILYRKI
ncbi:radical SAM protein [Eubacteriaceae bacterium ES2]|nr:radical SAM protein [Eubacteriaceae bacterium ES2]